MKAILCPWPTALLASIFILTSPLHLQAGNFTIASGEFQTGTMASGQIDAYTFTGNPGDSIIVRVGTTNFDPRIDFYVPGGAVATNAFTVNSNYRDAVLYYRLTDSGTFTIAVSSYFAGGTGTYGIKFAQIPGSFVVPASEAGGTLTNGAKYNGQINVGGFNIWSFTGTTGDSLQLRMGSTNFSPRIDVYGPDGTVLTNAFTVNSNYRDAWLALRLTNSGTFTVVVSSYFLVGDSGGYSLNLAQVPEPFIVSPGQQGGALVNGLRNSGFIGIGGLQMWAFGGNKGDSIQLRMGSTNFTPRIDLYGPDGALLTNAFTVNSNYRDAWLALSLTNSGTFTVVVSSYFLVGDSGGYSLNLAQVPEAFSVSPGEQGGALANGVRNNGQIGIGDLQMWAFEGNKGDSIQLRMGSTNFTPRIDLYGPDGALLTNAFTVNSNYRDASLALRLTNSGTFTVVASSYFLVGDFGGYSLTLAQIPGTFSVSPGEFGGALTNGFLHPGTLNIGDLNMWSFSGSAGDNIELRMGADAFDPRIDLYGPDGALLTNAFTVNSNYRDTGLDLQLTNNGTFTVVVSSYFPNDGGNYTLTLGHEPGEVFAAAGDEGGTMVDGFIYQGTNAVGDLDIWSFYGTLGDSNLFRMGATGTVDPWLRLYGPNGVLVAQAFSANSNTRTNFLTYIVTNAGNYTFVSSAYYPNETGPYNLKQSRVPPDLILPDTQTINEGNTLTLPVSAQDPDDAAKSLTFLLVSAPPGVVLTTLGATNASLSWTTTEADGPSTNLIVVTVTDVVLSKPFIRTNSFLIVVNELNTPPVLPTIPPQTVNELGTLTVTNTATDTDIPANPLTYTLVTFPQGATIDANGIISWKPTEAQGPSTNIITTVVTDTNAYAVNSRQMSATNTFQVVVSEVNTPPVLPIIVPQTINELATLTVTNTATDADIPANPLTYALVTFPQGATIDANGIISWKPTEAQGPSTNIITTVVTDTNAYAVNSRQMSATNTFQVIVNEVNTPPVLPIIVAQTIDELATLTVTNTATDTDLPANPLTYTLVTFPQGATIDANGIISWKPTETQGASTNTITTVVTDTNAYAINSRQMSATNTFQVVVNEVNTPPVLPIIGAQTIDELATLTVTNTATDTDLPANPLTYTLITFPQGATIDANGIISWKPTEAQGPSTNIITTVVTDTNAYAVNSRQMSATNSFQVVVNELNTPPVLPTILPQTVNELTTLTVTNTATDTDLPANPLTYTLVTFPPGATIDANGIISWKPTEAQGPSTNIITTVVIDTNAYAVNSRQMSATNTFQVIVNEVNLPPVLQAIADHTVHYGVLLSVQALAFDPDIPTNVLTFSLTLAPTNMTIDAGSGMITWTPALAQLGPNAVTVQVTDNGTPPLSVSTNFQVLVTGNQPQLSAQALAGHLVQLNVFGDTGVAYDLQVSTNLTSWLDLTSVSNSIPYIDPFSSSIPQRFYRLKLSQ